MLILLNKPYGVISQFSAHDKHPSLAKYVAVPNVYPAGRLDTDSEGLLLLTDDGRLQNTISHPLHKKPKTYVVQVEGTPSDAACAQLRLGIELGDETTLPCEAKIIDEPEWLWARNPPIRHRLNSPTHWLEITLSEGKNRQVRRMTAAVGLPTLRLIRTHIGDYSLWPAADVLLQPGAMHWVSKEPSPPSLTRSTPRAEPKTYQKKAKVVTDTSELKVSADPRLMSDRQTLKKAPFKARHTPTATGMKSIKAKVTTKK
jgi:23S rRNA pseudouridine2457 synthase